MSAHWARLAAATSGTPGWNGSTAGGFDLLFTSSRTFPRPRANPAPLIDAIHQWLSAGPPTPPIVEDWLTAAHQ